MNQTETERPADDASDGAEPGARPSDLDTLLEGFKANRATADEDLKPVIDYVKTEMLDRQNKAVETDIAAAAETLKENEKLKNVPNELLEGLMDTFARKDPSFIKAFENRESDPSTWKAKLGDGAEFASELMGKFSNVRTDIEAAAAAVDGTSQDVSDSSDLPSPEKLMSMSDGDFDDLLNAEIRKNAGA